MSQQYQTKQISQETLRRYLSPVPGGGTATLGNKRELVVVVRGIIERLNFPSDLMLTLGRGSQDPTRLIDLTPFGAVDRGVSRTHARLHIENDHLFLTDLGSTNGTFLAGERLAAYQPALVRKDDEILVGTLPLRVLFR